ncbi:MAG: hypothetical protein R3F59_10085 [Myxococcota bacterium]
MPVGEHVVRVGDVAVRFALPPGADVLVVPAAYPPLPELLTDAPEDLSALLREAAGADQPALAVAGGDVWRGATSGGWAPAAPPVPAPAPGAARRGLPRWLAPVGAAVAVVGGAAAVGSLAANRAAVGAEGVGGAEWDHAARALRRGHRRGRRGLRARGGRPRRARGRRVRRGGAVIAWLALTGCILPFPARPGPGSTDTARPTGETGQPTGETGQPSTGETGARPPPDPVDATALTLAGLSERWFPGVAAQVDGDGADELVLLRPTDGGSPAQWEVAEPVSTTLQAALGPNTAPSGACRAGPNDHYPVAARASLDGDALDDLVVGLSHPDRGGAVTLYTGPAHDEPHELCFDDDESFFGDGIAVADDAGGLALFATLSYTASGNDAGLAVLSLAGAAGMPATQTLQRADTVSWLILETQFQGASPGGTVAAVDLDHDGVDAAALGTEGDGFDPQRVYLLKQGLIGAVDAASSIDARVSGIAHVKQVRCFAAAVQALDLDGDGADELWAGLSADAQIGVVTASSTTAATDELLVGTLGGAVGPADSCFGEAIVGLDGGLVAVGAPLYERGEGRIYALDGAAMAAGARFDADEAYVFAVDAADTAKFGAALVVGDFDGDGIRDLAASGDIEEQRVYLLTVPD